MKYRYTKYQSANQVHLQTPVKMEVVVSGKPMQNNAADCYQILEMQDTLTQDADMLWTLYHFTCSADLTPV